ncbi:flagellar export protein FliJ [Aestuariibacter salexigens]|uniref:flagellar export protein FliJ n=1 Tax=Aestuariibacter salexigens TaxID=226010 RepID=UPI00041F4707|nr:flagellar export protein FliJ [Aestuariibacter salexigens]
MSVKQLRTALDWERDKEQQLARQFQLAQQQSQAEQHKLSSLEQYRLEYLTMTQNRAADGVRATHFSQHQSFIGKLDKACEQQVLVINRVNMVTEQRKQQWLAQQRKRKALEAVLEKREAQHLSYLDRQEQAMMDELALQKFLRK